MLDRIRHRNLRRSRTAPIIGCVMVVLVVIAAVGWQQASSARSDAKHDQQNSSEESISLRVDLRQAQRDLAKTKGQLESATGAVATLDAKANGTDATSRSERDRLVAFQRSLDKTKRALDQQAALLAASQSQLEANQAQAEQRNSELDLREADLAKRQADAEAQKRDLDARQAQLDQQASSLSP